MDYSHDAMDVDNPMQNGAKQANDWPDAPLDRNEFYRDLQAYHRSRGSNLDPNPRVHGKPIDLYDLFYNIEGRGGYDKVSAEKLLWRKIAAEFHLAANHAAASAFQIKTVYYKNLAAYAIKRVHKQEPPPKEILEDLTAKGSDLLSRTVHNFRTPRKHVDNFANGTPSAMLDEDGSENDNRGTPHGGEDDLYRSGRALRQAPPQRVFFQPDLSNTRQRQQVPQMVMPMQPSQTAAGYSTTNAALNANGTAFVAAKYESRTFPLSFRQVPTPSNNPAEFQDKVRKDRVEQLAEVDRLPPPKPQFIAPGTGFAGPNIYYRSIMGLRSGIKEEQQFALSHLVKISHERGDKFRFEAFTGFAEGLIEKSLEIASLYYDVAWQISYMKGDELQQNNILDGIDSTPDILSRISKLRQLPNNDTLAPPDYCDDLQLCMEAMLVLRNMSMLQDNARYLAEEQIIVKDLLVIVLNLPSRPDLVEVKNDALDIAEQLTEYWALELDDPFYLTLIKYLEQGRDRGAAISSLRALCRISLQLEETNKLQGFSTEILNMMIRWCYLEDEELVGACLDFFYQYTAVPENVLIMLNEVEQDELELLPFLEQLARLLLHDAKEVKILRQISHAKPLPPVTAIPQVPQDLLEQIINITEPERSSAWLRACFEEDKDSEMTQISLWQAYQNRFQYFSNSTSKPMLAAADFIKRISETFKNTSAQVLQNQTPPKFIIRGIRPRRVPVDLKGRPYIRCLWVDHKQPSVCDQYALTPEKLYEHIVTAHLAISRGADGKWDLASARKKIQDTGRKLHCHWGSCERFAKTDGTDNLPELGLHIRTHLPDTSEGAEEKARHNNPSKRRKIDVGPIHDLIDPIVAQAEPAKYQEFIFRNTASRDMPNGQVEAEGLPLSAILILRNMARSIPKAVAGPGQDAKVKYWYGRLLKPLMNQIWHVASTNLTIMANIFDFLAAMDKESGSPIFQPQG